MGLINVIHKVRAFIDGRTYGPGEAASIDEVHFNSAVHDEVDADGNVIERKPEVAPAAAPEPPPLVPGTEANQATDPNPPAPIPARASNFVVGSPTVEDKAQSEPVAYDDSGVVKGKKS